jgi:hypothetical protein
MPGSARLPVFPSRTPPQITRKSLFHNILTSNFFASNILRGNMRYREENKDSRGRGYPRSRDFLR